MLERAIDAAEVSPELGVDATLDALLGPLVYCALTRASLALSPAAWSRTC
ncbi:hypothetical protein ACIBG0_06725 [Nocardia sp. NPDC050630]